MRRLAVVLLLAAPSARAAPSDVTLVPPGGARLFAGQRFDLRVEGRGAPPYRATLSVDGKPVAVDGAQGTGESDGITAAGWGGFDARALSIPKPGPHVLRATFQDATGSVDVESRIEV